MYSTGYIDWPETLIRVALYGGFRFQLYLIKLRMQAKNTNSLTEDFSFKRKKRNVIGKQRWSTGSRLILTLDAETRLAVCLQPV